jgi:MFS-type transporter involved in bile tolerance (Atg22 family)
VVYAFGTTGGLEASEFASDLEGKPKVKASAPLGSARKASSVAVWSWVLYDFANTIFSVSVLSYFFPLWLGDELGLGGASLFNYVTAASMLLVALTSPFFGAAADLRQRRKPHLILLTLLFGEFIATSSYHW